MFSAIVADSKSRWGYSNDFIQPIVSSRTLLFVNEMHLGGVCSAHHNPTKNRRFDGAARCRFLCSNLTTTHRFGGAYLPVDQVHNYGNGSEEMRAHNPAG